MTHYFCIAIGDADFMPNSQEYHSAENESEMREIIAGACAEWERQRMDCDSDEFYSHAFRMPRDGEDNYSQRLRIAEGGGDVLDVIGMTHESFERESAE
jgi:hypothetical protein